MKKVLAGVGFLLCALACGIAAKADTIGTLSLPGCGFLDTDCPAANYHFDITGTSATLTITIKGLPTLQNDYIGTVNLGFSPSSNINGLALTAAPTALSYWTDTTGSLNSNGNGCGINSGAFACATALALIRQIRYLFNKMAFTHGLGRITPLASRGETFTSERSTVRILQIIHGTVYRSLRLFLQPRFRNPHSWFF